LTEDERRLGQLPGFTPERIEQWLETYPGEVLGLPNHTGSPPTEDPTGNIISTPNPEAVGPNIVTMENPHSIDSVSIPKIARGIFWMARGAAEGIGLERAFRVRPNSPPPGQMRIFWRQ
jgi:hypothetical protein